MPNVFGDPVAGEEVQSSAPKINAFGDPIEDTGMEQTPNVNAFGDPVETPTLPSPAAPRGTIASPSNVNPPSSRINPDGSPMGEKYDQEATDAIIQRRFASSPLRRTIGDAGIALAKGIVGVPETVVGIADIPTLGYAGKGAEKIGINFKGTQDALSNLYSPEARQAQERVGEGFDKGIIPGVKSVIQNPSTIMTGAVESTPTMFAGGAIGKVVKGLPILAKLGPTVAPIVAGAVGEGSVTAGQNIEQVRQSTDTGTLTPAQVALNTASGILTAALGVAGGKAAKWLKIDDPDTLMAGGTSGATRNVIMKAIGGMVSEGLLEELPQSIQEQISQNISLGKPWDEGVAQSGAMGAIIGGIMGSGANVVGSVGEGKARNKAEALKIRMQNTRADEEANLRQTVYGVASKMGLPPEQALKVALADDPHAEVMKVYDEITTHEAERAKYPPLSDLIAQSKADMAAAKKAEIDAQAKADLEVKQRQAEQDRLEAIHEALNPEPGQVTTDPVTGMQRATLGGREMPQEARPVKTISTPKPDGKPIPGDIPVPENQTISPPVAVPESAPGTGSPPVVDTAQGANSTSKPFGELRAGDTVNEDGRTAKITKVSHSDGEVLAELEDGRVISATPESMTTTISPPEKPSDQSNKQASPEPIASDEATKAGEPISNPQPVEGVQPPEQASRPGDSNPEAEAVSAENEKAKPTTSKVYPWDTKTGDIYDTADGGNRYVMNRFDKLRDAQNAVKMITENSGEHGLLVKVRPWLAKSPTGKRTISMWDVEVHNVSQGLAKQLDGIRRVMNKGVKTANPIEEAMPQPEKSATGSKSDAIKGKNRRNSEKPVSAVGTVTPPKSTAGREAVSARDNAGDTYLNPPAPVAEPEKEPIFSDTYKGPRYTYGMRYRPLQIGAQPKGWIIDSQGPATERFRFGTIQYPRQLTADEVKSYELEEVKETTKTEAVKTRVHGGKPSTQVEKESTGVAAQAETGFKSGDRVVTDEGVGTVSNVVDGQIRVLLDSSGRYSKYMSPSRVRLEDKTESNSDIDLTVTGQSKPVPDRSGAEYVVHHRKPDMIPDKYRVIISRQNGYLSVDGTGITAQEAYDKALRAYDEGMDKRKADSEAKASEKNPDKAVLSLTRAPNGGIYVEVQPIRETKPEIKSPIANLSAEKQARLAEIQAKLRKNLLGRASMGFDPENLTLAAEMATLYAEGGVKTFAQFAKSVKVDMADAWGQIKQYLHGAWQAAGATDDSLDDVSRTGAKATIEKLDSEALTSSSDGKTIVPKEGNTDESGPTNLGRHPKRVESGNAERVGGETRTDGNQPGERVGGVKPETVEGVGGGRDVTGTGEGSPGSGDAGAGSGEPGRNDSSKRGGSKRTVRRTEPQAVTPTNYRITESDRIGKGGLASKYQDNISAIRLLKKIESEGRKATPEEQAVLVRYVGWGGLKGAFDPKNKQWGAKNADLIKLLTPEEYEAARRSVLDAHYTSETIVRDGVYAAMKRLGFPGGSMVEAGLGTGHFIGMMPDEMRARSSYLGIEQDPLTARIAQQLYPESKIHNMGFQDADLARESFDGAVGNPPFGSQSLYDSKFREESKHSIHNYFIAKTLSLLRPGGVSGFVVSHYFLDSTDTAARKQIAKLGDFLGAIRLPNTTFKENANTEVTTDLVFFRRRAEGSKSEGNDSWVKTATMKDEKTGQNITVNKWLADNPEMMLGKLTLGGTMYGGKMEATLESHPGQILSDDLKRAVEQLPENVYESSDRDTAKRLTTPEPIDVPENSKIGSIFMGKDGRVMRRMPDVQMESRAEPVELKDATSKDRIKGMVSVRDALNKLVKAELSDDYTDSGLETLRDDLNRAYDEFKKDFGYLNQDKNRRLFYDDPEAARLLALEKGFDRGLSADAAKKQGAQARKPTASKAAIFEKRVNAPYREITSVETPKEALMASLNQRGLVDLEYMSKISGKSTAELESSLGDLVFKSPAGEYQSKEQYLSGNVRKKMMEAEAIAKDDPTFQKNVDALKAVIPKDIDPTDIIAPVGAPWVDSKDVSKFAEDLTGTTPKVSLFRKHDSGWMFEHHGNGTAETQQWGTNRMPFGELFRTMLNGKPVVVYDKIRNADGSESMIANQQETALAQAKSDEIAEKWRTWLWKDADRRARLHRTYNDRYNNYVDPHYDGSHLTLPGASSLITLRPHQKNVVWRTLTDMKALYDHVVGAGKTFAGIASFMEMKRLGRVRKPLFVVPNHLVWQWRDDFVKLYPNANILHTEPSDFGKDKRQKVFAKIMTGDYDAVIVGHSSFKKIGVSPEVESKFLQEMVSEITQSIEETKAAELEAGRRKRSRTLAQMEKTKEAMEEKLAALADRTGQKDQVATFEELGIDGLFVDEAHEFKNLFYTTQMQNVSGMGSPKGSGKAFDLYIKTRYMRDKFQGKAPTVFATGTPISNSLVEMYTMQRYLQPDVLADMGAKTLDGWAKVFADVRGVYEVDPTGTGYRLSTRFANFQNVGELSAAYRSVADVVTMSDLQAAAEAEGKRFPVPKVKGGKPQNIIAERSPDQTNFFGVQTHVTDGEGNPVYDNEGNPVMEYPKGSILHRVDNMPKDPSVDNMLKLTNDARKAGLDMRLIDPSYPDHPGSKINSAVKEMVRIYKQWNADKGTQLVFCDLSVPASARGKATAEAKAAVGEFYFDNRRGEITPVEDAVPVKIDGAPEGIEFFAYKDGSEWRISERSTGLSLSSGGSKKMALIKAKTRIEGMKNLETAIKEKAVPLEQVAEAKEKWILDREARDAAKTDATDTDQQADDESNPGISMDELLADSSTFSVYDDVKKKLVKAKIPEHEIAFIHDFDTPAKKAKLFKDVNSGNVRILMGSTPKMGAGMNVQERLVAAHHLDAPWRPSDLEQREGRIIRQGNSLYSRDPESFEAEILRYATNRTYDTRMWQLIEHKTAGIEGFRRADRNTRTIADVSGEAANAADMKAAASGDPRIQKELQLRTERQKLENMRKAWERNRYELESRKTWLDGAEAREKSIVDELSKLIAIRDANTPKDFSFTMPDGAATENKGEIVDNIITGIKSGKFSGPVGKYRGFDFKWSKGVNDLTIRANNEIVATYGEKDRLDGVGFIRRLDNWMASWDSRIQQTKDITARQKSEAIEVSQELEKPFTKSAELDKTRVDHEAVRRDLMESNKKRPQQSQTADSARAMSTELDNTGGKDYEATHDNGTGTGTGRGRQPSASTVPRSEEPGERRLSGDGERFQRGLDDLRSEVNRRSGSGLNSFAVEHLQVDHDLAATDSFKQAETLAKAIGAELIPTKSTHPNAWHIGFIHGLKIVVNSARLRGISVFQFVRHEIGHAVFRDPNSAIRKLSTLIDANSPAFKSYSEAQYRRYEKSYLRALRESGELKTSSDEISAKMAARRDIDAKMREEFVCEVAAVGMDGNRMGVSLTGGFGKNAAEARRLLDEHNRFLMDHVAKTGNTDEARFMSPEEDTKTDAERQLLEVLGIHEHGAAQGKEEAKADAMTKMAALKARMQEKAKATTNSKLSSLKSRMREESLAAVNRQRAKAGLEPLSSEDAPTTPLRAASEAYKAGKAEEQEKGRMVSLEYSVDKGFREQAKERGAGAMEWLEQSAEHLAILDDQMKLMKDGDDSKDVISDALKHVLGEDGARLAIRAAKYNVKDVLKYVREVLDKKLTGAHTRTLAKVFDQYYRQQAEIPNPRMDKLTDEAKSRATALLDQFPTATKVGVTVADLKGIKPEILKKWFNEWKELMALNRLDREVRIGKEKYLADQASERLVSEVSKEHEPMVSSGVRPKNTGTMRDMMVDFYANQSLLAQRAFGGLKSLGHELFYRSLERGENEYKAQKHRAQSALGKELDRLGVTFLKKAAMMTELKPIKAGDQTIMMTAAERMHLAAFVGIENEGKITGGRVIAKHHIMRDGFIRETMAGTTAKITSDQMPVLVADIIKTLTPTEKSIVKKIVEIQTGMGQDGNRVSRQLLGRSLFTEDWYMGMKPERITEINADDLGTNQAAQKFLENSGFTKTVIEHRMPIKIGNIFSAFDEHVDGMSRYIGLTIPLRNIRTAMKANDGALTREINGRMGTDWTRRVTQTMMKLAGAKNQDQHGPVKVLSTLSGNVMRSVLAWNPSSYFNNRVPGAIMMASAIAEKYPKAAAKIIAGLVVPTQIKTKLNPIPLTRFGEENERARAFLMEHGYLGDRWDDDYSSIASPVNRDVASQLKGKAQMIIRHVSNVAMNPMMHAEIRNGIDAFKALRAEGLSETEARDLVADATRATQNSSSALDDSAFIQGVRDFGLGGLFPFLSQNVVTRNFLMSNIVDGDKKGAVLAFAGISAGIAGTVFFRSLMRSMRNGPDDDKDKAEEERIINTLNQAADTILPGIGIMVEPMLNTAFGQYRSGGSLIFERQLGEVSKLAGKIVSGKPVDADAAAKFIKAMTQLLGLPTGGLYSVGNIASEMATGYEPESPREMQDRTHNIISNSAKRLPSRASDGRIRLEALKAYREAKRRGLLKPGVTEAEFRARYKQAFKRLNP